MNRLFKTLFVLASAAFLASCASTKDIVYFQDTQDGYQVNLPEPKIVTVEISDKLSIVVSSKNPELAAVFNLPIASYSAGASRSSSSFGGGGGISVYTVDTNGNIDFPILGTLHVQGLTREQVARTIKELIISRKLIMDAVVTVEFANLYVSVLGDVRSPGRHEIDKDKVTILDILSKAGDTQITGLRKNVKVYREQDGKQVCYELDLTSADNVFTSPVYYMQQDDIVYVEPNRMKRRDSTVNGNTFASVSFWMSATSFLTSITTLVLSYMNIKK